jgi:hypothetical protein
MQTVHFDMVHGGRKQEAQFHIWQVFPYRQDRIRIDQLFLCLIQVYSLSTNSHCIRGVFAGPVHSTWWDAQFIEFKGNRLCRPRMITSELCTHYLITGRHEGGQFTTSKVNSTFLTGFD